MNPNNSTPTEGKDISAKPALSKPAGERQSEGDPQETTASAAKNAETRCLLDATFFDCE